MNSNFTIKSIILHSHINIHQWFWFIYLTFNTSVYTMFLVKTRLSSDKFWLLKKFEVEFISLSLCMWFFESILLLHPSAFSIYISDICLWCVAEKLKLEWIHVHRTHTHHYWEFHQGIESEPSIELHSVCERT